MTQTDIGPTGDQSAKKYIPDPGLVDAAEVAVDLGLPLLLTGEPGTGKTECASWIAYNNGCSLYKFVAKSTSVSTDLFYTYDALSRFSSSQLATFIEAERVQASEPKNFIEYAALGQAILSAHPAKEVSSFLGDVDAQYNHPGKPKRSVVLIDEIDKAPRDFPNDLLDEIANMQFRIRELGNVQTPSIADTSLKPIVVITSNSERQLPGPFLRRCAYYNITFPERRDPDRQNDEEGQHFIDDIIVARLGKQIANSRLGKDAIEFFYHLRNELRPALGRNPATAELLNWMVAIQPENRRNDDRLTSPANRKRALRAITLLAKNKPDQERVRRSLEDWTDSQG